MDSRRYQASGEGEVMASKYYIKLYHEILEDPKMMKLTDRLFSLSIKLFLLAGDYEQNGYLPNVEDMAWRLRDRIEDLETDLSDLATAGIVQMKDDNWYVTKFEARQAPVNPTERWHRWKDRQRKDDYYQTDDNESANEVQTKRLTDKIRLDKKRIDKIKVDNETIPDSLQVDSFLLVWEEWIQYRKEIKKTLKPTTIKRQLARLNKYRPEVAAEMLAQSIENQWTGIFELKDSRSVSKRDVKVQADGSINV